MSNKQLTEVIDFSLPDGRSGQIRVYSDEFTHTGRNEWFPIDRLEAGLAAMAAAGGTVSRCSTLPAAFAALGI